MTSKTPVRVAEDVDESSLNYAEIKALATENPLIKEKMDLENDVTKLKMLEANYKSNLFTLQDKIIKTYPKEIERMENLIEDLKMDKALTEPLKDDENKFTSMEINGIKYTDKKEAGEKLIETLKSLKMREKTEIGRYRNFPVEVSYDSFSNKYQFNLKGNTGHYGELGQSADGNITRMDNVLEKIDERIKISTLKLENTKEQLLTAKVEVQKPFERAEELKNKTLRLSELNKILDMGEVEELNNPNPKIEDLKRAIIDFCNEEYSEHNSYEDFRKLYLDEEHVGIAYTTTEDGEHEIQFEMNLKEYSWTQYVDNRPVSHESYLEMADGNSEKAIEIMKSEIIAGDFDEFVHIDENDLKNNLGLLINDEGNIYDPLSKDLDNDGIPDRYDNDFKDSDYFESVYDVEDNLNQKENADRNEKPSTIEILNRYKNELNSENNINIDENNKDKDQIDR